MRILVLNGGSSSVKAMLYNSGKQDLPPQAQASVWSGRAEWGRRTGTAQLRLTVPGQDSAVDKEITGDSVAKVFDAVIRGLWEGGAAVVSRPEDIDVVGHRIVHGGPTMRETTRITPEVRSTIAGMAAIAPEHTRGHLEGIDATERLLGGAVPQYAVFDTAFHATIPIANVIYPLPFEFFEQGIRRYGFHGISHQYVARRAAEILGRGLSELRLVTCHLGNGASLTAVRNGASVDTTMGFTPL